MSVTLDYLLEPVSHWLDDQAVEEVCINGPGEAWVYSRGAFARHDVPALDVDWIEDIAIVAAAQRRQDISHRRPLLATDLVGRGRLQAVIYPCVAGDRPSLTIRRGSVEWPTLESLAAGGLFKHAQAQRNTVDDDDLLALYRAHSWHAFIALAVRKKKTIVICGENASGKTHISKAALGEVPLDERLITIEDAPELRGLPHPNRVSLYYDKDAEDGAITASELVEAALRMRIGRLFLQEIRDGAAAIAFLLALQTGHRGGITTIHATDCTSVFDRLRVLIKQTPGGAAVSDADITSQLYSLIDVVVHAARDGSTFMVDEVWFRRCET